MSDEIISVRDISGKALSDINDRKDGLPTGLYQLDDKIRGLKPAEYVIIAARPSMGKTSLAVDIALESGKENRVVFFSIEMSPTMVVQRMLANLAEVNLYKFYHGQLLDSAFGKLEMAKKELERRDIWFDNSSYITPNSIANKISRVDDIDMVIIDYIQLMGGTGGNNVGRVEEMSDISRRLKALALNLNKPVVVLSQLNRSPDIRDNHRPFLSDLRDSGSLEQDADIILFLYREDYYKPNLDDGNAEIIVAKNRNGPTGKVNCFFNKGLARFEDYKKESEVFK